MVLGLLMVWLSKRFIDETIRTGTADDVLRMVELLVLTVEGDALYGLFDCIMISDQKGSN